MYFAHSNLIINKSACWFRTYIFSERGGFLNRDCGDGTMALTTKKDEHMVRAFATSRAVNEASVTSEQPLDLQQPT